MMTTGLRISVAEFDRMIEAGAFHHCNRKIELIRGELREMNPAGPLHDDLIIYLTDWSTRVANRSQVRVSVQIGLDLREWESRPEPDLMWIDARRYRHRHPSARDVKLAIEVADSSLKTDLSEKAQLYAEAGVMEYWIVDAQGKCVYVFRNPHDGAYQDRQTAKSGEFLLPLTPCSSPLDLRDLFEPTQE
jgi:Uma2 family endonuclease